MEHCTIRKQIMTHQRDMYRYIYLWMFEIYFLRFETKNQYLKKLKTDKHVPANINLCLAEFDSRDCVVDGVF